MSGSLNKVTLLGRLGKDPEVRTTQQGVPVVSFSIATGESYKDKRTGEKKENVQWHNIVVWGRVDGDSLATIAEKYLKKGQRVYVEGQLKTRKWQDQQGNDRWSTEVVLNGFDAKLILIEPQGSGNRGPDSPDDYGTTRSQPPAQNSVPDDLDDSIPF